MTEAMTPVADPAATVAWRRAEEAARRSGVTVGDLSEPADLVEAERLLIHIWGSDSERPPMSRDVMRAMAYAGGYVAGAWDETALVGVSVGFITAPEGTVQLHSHLAGAAPETAGRHVGTALKLHQRAWALGRGIDTITWTFDPLVRRNAYFNLVKLGAVATRYLTDFYGDMDDGINAGQGSDRLLARWELRSERAARAAAGGRVEADAERWVADGQTLLTVDAAGEPIETVPARPGTPLVVAVPPDIEALRRADPIAARRWRGAVRRALAPALAAGCRIDGFARSGWYLLTEDRGHGAPPDRYDGGSET